MFEIDHIDGVGRGERIVRRPRATDAVGRALRGVFATTRLPADMADLIERLGAFATCSHR